MLSAVLLSSIYSCLKKEKRGSLKLWKHTITHRITQYITTDYTPSTPPKNEVIFKAEIDY